ncbi:Hypothetical protein NTJ_00420 [Nesidiocoris tenuis]|uniref:Uncharacterized protein n=1 Tax=Nesidiocoris tenuis TaxID=355587 RepID=A0ABN7A8Z6_9HEMI|nr:Hypothetical protein NTJ_00420 [Nesidiocoris tenuis]
MGCVIVVAASRVSGRRKVEISNRNERIYTPRTLIIFPSMQQGSGPKQKIFHRGVALGDVMTSQSNCEADRTKTIVETIFLLYVENETPGMRANSTRTKKKTFSGGGKFYSIFRSGKFRRNTGRM